MLYELMGRMHAEVVARLARADGQGTVEYVGLILLIGVIVAAVVKAGKGMGDDGIAKMVVDQLKGAIEGVKG